MQQHKQPDKKLSTSKPAEKLSNSKDLKNNLKKALQLLTRYQVVIIILLVASLLALTTVKMLHYSDPAPDDQRIQENLGKVKKIRVDAKAVERIKQLDDSETSTGSNIQDNRSNPFSE